MQTLKSYLDGFLSLFYPHLCLACEANAPMPNHIICTHCEYALPQTNYHLDKDNTFTERLWGRFPLHSAAAYYHFTKRGKVQRLIHHLKYDHKPKVGQILGKRYGIQLRQAPLFRPVDMILSVPLHPKKKRQRGYNQADYFARGLAESMEVPFLPDILIRTKMTDSQTKKSRLERLENVGRAFELRDASKLQNKHVLLVDDVMTTGATLEACALKILEVPNVVISLATIALAD